MDLLLNTLTEPVYRRTDRRSMKWVLQVAFSLEIQKLATQFFCFGNRVSLFQTLLCLSMPYLCPFLWPMFGKNPKSVCLLLLDKFRNYELIFQVSACSSRWHRRFTNTYSFLQNSLKQICLWHEFWRCPVNVSAATPTIQTFLLVFLSLLTCKPQVTSGAQILQKMLQPR